MLQLLGRFRATSAARRAFVLNAQPCIRFENCHAVNIRLKSAKPGPGKPTGLKAGVQPATGLSPTMQMLVVYVAVAMSSMAVIGRYKSLDAEADESVRIYNMAKRAVVKDHRVFGIVGYPKEFERINEVDAEGFSIAHQSCEGRFKVAGDKGSVVVHYRRNQLNDDNDSDTIAFDRLSVHCEDGSQFSALESFMQNQTVVTHEKAESLSTKMFIPVIGGVLIGGVASFFAVRILRNRPFYVHKLVLDHINNHDMARNLLGNPIKCDRSKYVGVLTGETANYTIACNGPKGNGTIIVKASKKLDEVSNGKEGNLSEVMSTPGTSWKFSTLVLSVSRSESRIAKHAQTINLLTHTH